MERGIVTHRLGKQARAVILASVMLALAPGFVRAQDAGPVSSYRLPPGPTASPPPAQGPVDSDAPVVRPTLAPAQPSPEPRPSPRAMPTEAGGTPSPSPRLEPRGQAAPRTVPGNAPTVAAPPATMPTNLPSEAAAPSPSTPGTPAPTPSAVSLQPAGDEGDNYFWPIAAAVAALIMALAGTSWWRRQAASPADRREVDVPADVLPPSAPAALPPVSPAPASPPPLKAPESRPTSPEPSVAAVPAHALALACEVDELSRSLIYATLSCRLTLTNAGSAPLKPFQVMADLGFAHASLSAEQQLLCGPDPQLAQTVPGLEPGESHLVSGRLRLALADVRTIRQGDAALFVPLVRVRMASAEGAWEDARAFAVGEPGQRGENGLRPLRLDTMPGVTRGLVQREILLDLTPAAV